MSNKNLSYLFLLIILVCWGCSNTKYLPEGELLYIGAKVKVEDSILKRKQRKALAKELQGLVRPKPNSKILGLRPKLWIYNVVGEPKKEKGLKHWLRTKVGEPPVLFSQVDLSYNSDVLQSYAENRGYFKARTEADSTEKKRRASADFTARPGVQYKIKDVFFPEDSSAISEAIRRTQRRSALKKGDAYDLDVIRAERERIDSRLKEKGFYFFGPDYLLIKVDSTVGKHEVDLRVTIKDETPPRAKEIFRINDIFVYPNFSIKSDTLAYDPDDIIQHGDFTIIDTTTTFKPFIFDRTLSFKKGDIYNRTDHNLSLNRLVNMGPFQFVKNEFRVADSKDNLLDAYYFLTPSPKKSIRVELAGKTNSANYTGTELTVNWSNRNAFKGAELLNISAFGGIEVQVSGQNQGFNVYRVGSEASIIWPRFITPFKVHTASGFVPRTRAAISYEYQNREKLYSLNSFRGSFGYLWKEDVTKEHQLNVTDITFVSPTNVTELYLEQVAENPSLEKVIEKQLIFGPTYSYTFTNTMRKRKKHTFYYRGGVDLSGTLAGLFTGANAKEGDTIKLFDVPFSQFVRLENDFRHYMRLSENSTLASRIIVGAGFAYGNSNELPFIKQFFIGGTNSIRAFRARSIGPGSYMPDTDENSFLPDQSGDIKLEFNTEYRAKLFSVVNGAIFLDAGNIWLLNENPDQPGAEFKKDFLKELAVGTGVGLRFDLSFLVLRTDLAFPLRKPYLPEGERWVGDNISFGDSAWRRENLVFNLAIGYPF
ncbi:MAG TPA: BamA/TamA family outer membrane protein [Flavobacterium sp.]